MVTLRSFPVLVTIVLFGVTSSDGYMLDSTCTTIQNQLWYVGQTISTAAQQFTPGPYYESYTVDSRLRLLLKDYTDSMAWYSQRMAQLTTYVKRKMQQFSIASHGLEDNTVLLDRIFQHVEERNAFQRLQLQELEEVNRSLGEENGALRTTVATLANQKLQLEQRVANATEALAVLDKETRKLQAKLNGNPVHVQG